MAACTTDLPKLQVRIPEFLSIDEVLVIHRNLVRRYGGSAEVSSHALLDSALAQPQVSFGKRFLHRTLFEMAAAYLFHIVQNHPFVDGNKRTGAACADVFLAMNNVNLVASEKDFEHLTFETAKGSVNKREIALFFQKNSKRLMTN